LRTEQTLLVYAAYNLVAALVSYPIGRLSDRFGRKRLLVAAFAMLALAFGGFATTTTGAAFALLFLLYGIYQGAFRALGKALAVDLAPDTLRGSAVGLFGTVVGLAALVAGTVGGQLWDRAGPGATFAYGATFAVLGGALLSVVLPRQNPRRGEPIS
ncbi:MAG: MFS transporter, partial [Chloroflexi bacterium]